MARLAGILLGMLQAMLEVNGMEMGILSQQFINLRGERLGWN